MNWYKKAQGWPIGLSDQDIAKEGIQNLSPETLGIGVDVLKKYVKQFNKKPSKEDLAYLLENFPQTKWEKDIKNKFAKPYYYEKFAKLVFKKYDREMNGTNCTGPR